MLLRLRGEQVTKELIDVVASLTDRSRLRHAEVAHDPATGTVTLTITRFPLIKRRRVFSNIHDFRNPIPAVVTVRNVASCGIQNNAPHDLGDEIQLIFGLQIRDNQVYACSAEEDRGQPCFSLTIEVSELDIEIADVTDINKGQQ